MPQIQSRSASARRQSANAKEMAERKSGSAVRRSAVASPTGHRLASAKNVPMSMPVALPVHDAGLSDGEVAEEIDADSLHGATGADEVGEDYGASLAA